MQTLIIAGNVGKDAELRNTQGGESVLNFTVAVSNGKDKDGNDRPATWFDCSLWGKRADSLKSYITKGSKLTVRGRPTARAHDGKAYLGLTVDDLTFMGSTGQRDDSSQRQSSQARAADRSQRPGGGYGGGRSDLDDEIPFAPNFL